MNKILVFISLFLILSFTIKAQNMVFSFDKETTGLEMKWYTEKLTYNEGVFVYRKTKNSEWQKVSKLILPKNYHIDNNQLLEDSTLAEMKEFLEEETSQDERHPLIVANLMIKSFESRELAKYLGIYFRDNLADPQARYEYKVLTPDGSLVFKSGEIKPSELKKVAPPKDLKIRKMGRVVKFSWQDETLRYYAVNIFRKTPEETAFTKQNKLPIATSENEDKIYYEQKIPHIKGTFTYKVQAIDFWGNTSGFSQEQQVVFKNMKKASPAYSFKVDSVVTDEALLSWKCADDPLNKGFRLYHKTTEKGEWKLYNNTLLEREVRVLKLENIQAGDHYFSMASMNEDNVPNHSNTALVVIEDIIPPSVVTNLNGNMVDRKIVLSWDKSRAIDFHSYLVYKSFTGDEYLLDDSRGVLENTFSSEVDKRVKTKLYYKIVARDSSMNSSEYSEPVIIEVKDVFPPSTPVIKGVKVTDGMSRISWVKNKEPDLKGYNLRRCKESNCKVIVFGLEASSSSYEDITINDLGEVTYSILAVDTSGNKSEYSQPFKVRTQAKNSTQKIALEVKHRKEKYKLKWNDLTDLKKLYVLTELDGITERKELDLDESKYKYEGNADSILLKGYFKNGTTVKSNHWIKKQGNE